MEVVLPTTTTSTTTPITHRFSTCLTSKDYYLCKLIIIFIILVFPLSVFLFPRWHWHTNVVSSYLLNIQQQNELRPSSISNHEEDAPQPQLLIQDLLDIRWNQNQNHSNLPLKICITSTTAAGLERLLPWILYHKVIGVSDFFLFVEGEAATHYSSQLLASIPGVHTIPRTRELEEQQAKSRIWNDTRMTFFANKPCNHALFLKQNLNMEMAIVMAREAGMEWIFHLDTDELLHPAGTTDYSMIQLLTQLPTDVDTVVFLNYEAAVERDDIKESFSEVSMFKKNFGHLLNDSSFNVYYNEAARSNPDFFLAYGNGKSGARMQQDLAPSGAHRWEYDLRTPKEITMKEAAILHYTYSRFSDLTTRRDRCNCKPTKEETEKCFFLPFERSAFIIASVSTQDEMRQWYNEHVVWNDDVLKDKLLKAGILTRIYAPLVIIRRLMKSGVFDHVMATANASSAGIAENMKLQP